MDAQHKKRLAVIGTVIGAVLIFGAGWYYFSSKPTAPAAQNQAPPMAMMTPTQSVFALPASPILIPPNPPPAPPPVVQKPPCQKPAVAQKPQPSAEALEIANLRKQMANMERLAEKAVTAATTAAEIAQKDNQALQERLRAVQATSPGSILDPFGNRPDVILKMGHPARRQADAEYEMVRKSHQQPAFRPEPVRRVCEPPPAEIQRRIAELKAAIEAADSDLVIANNNVLGAKDAMSMYVGNEQTMKDWYQNKINVANGEVCEVKARRQNAANELIQLERQLRQQ